MQNWFLYNKRKGKCEHKLGYYLLLYIPRSCNIKPELRIPPFLKALAVDTDRIGPDFNRTWTDVSFLALFK